MAWFRKRRPEDASRPADPTPAESSVPAESDTLGAVRDLRPADFGTEQRQWTVVTDGTADQPPAAAETVAHDDAVDDDRDATRRFTPVFSDENEDGAPKVEVESAENEHGDEPEHEAAGSTSASQVDMDAPVRPQPVPEDMPGFSTTALAAAAGRLHGHRAPEPAEEPTSPAEPADAPSADARPVPNPDDMPGFSTLALAGAAGQLAGHRAPEHENAEARRDDPAAPVEGRSDGHARPDLNPDDMPGFSALALAAAAGKLAGHRAPEHENAEQGSDVVDIEPVDANETAVAETESAEAERADAVPAVEPASQRDPADDGLFRAEERHPREVGLGVAAAGAATATGIAVASGRGSDAEDAPALDLAAAERERLAKERQARREAREAALAPVKEEDALEESPAETAKKSKESVPVTDRFAGSLGLFLLRAVAAFVLLVHGMNGVLNKEATLSLWQNTVLPSPKYFALVVPWVEVVLALLLLFGLLSRAAGLITALVMALILAFIMWGHWSIFTPGAQGFLGESELLTAVIGLAILFLGAGSWSIDHLARRERAKTE